LECGYCSDGIAIPKWRLSSPSRQRGMNPLKVAVLKALRYTLPQRLKRALVHSTYHIANAELERFIQVNSWVPSMALGLELLAKRGLSPRTIIDVGAFRGGWSLLANQVWPRAKLYMVEPNLNEKERVSAIAKRLDATLFHDLLGAQNGLQVEFSVMQPGSETGSSILHERSPVGRSKEKRILTTLDSLPIHLESPGFLKIDAQGYELEILRGASSCVEKIEAVLLEVALIEVNEGAPLLSEVVAFMDNVNFVASDIVEMHRRPLDGATAQVDVLFIRKGSAILSDLRYSE
jgi:FkbM family methyltransferase